MPDLELVQGTLDFLILRTLNWGPQHGFGVARWIRNVTGERLQIEDGALYPALHRMEQKGWIEAEWGLSETNRRVKSYRMSGEGEKHFRSEASSWVRFAAAMAQVLDATQPPAWARQS